MKISLDIAVGMVFLAAGLMFNPCSVSSSPDHDAPAAVSSSIMIRKLAVAPQRPNCIGPSQPCGALDWCCQGLTCDGFFDGRCHTDPTCVPLGKICDVRYYKYTCCYPGHCGPQRTCTLSNQSDGDGDDRVAIANV